MKTGVGILAIILLAIGVFVLIPTSGQPTNNINKEGSVMDYSHVSAKKATIKTEKGDIVLELYPNDAPKTVTNFATLAANGYYDGLKFHRAEIGIIQGGDPLGDGTGGESIYGPEFEDELNPETNSYKTGYADGVIAMANRGPNTNSSQFFINQVDNNDQFAKAYTIFGRVIEGMDVVKSIQKDDKIISITIN